MKKRPIIFSGEMVQAILDGRKTQTRRVIKPQPELCHGCQTCEFRCDHFIAPLKQIYEPGMRLWVKETWRLADRLVDGYERDCPYYIQYKADSLVYDLEGVEPECKPNLVFEHQNFSADKKFGKWKSARFMFKKYARIWLEIKDVRVERVQDISTDDIIREGIPLWEDAPDKKIGNILKSRRDEIISAEDAGEKVTSAQIIDYGLPSVGELIVMKGHKEKFVKLWNSINEKREFGWNSNPWIWVIEFERINT